ncbi:MAG: RsbRD N-terminal domain-containing protein [Ignavibacteria bacterium]|nr:RsbRD N-terminal domain-containing protein [Ignavibacteria bacterium]
MPYKSLLKYNSSIVNKWIKLILDSYSTESSNFFNLEKNQFSNPVGNNISNNAASIFDEIVGSRDFDKITLLLTDIIKMRAIQDFSPSEAVGFIFPLKKIIREEFNKEINQQKLFDEIAELETVIDRVALIAFDLYMEAREKVFQIRMNEARFKIQKAVNQVTDI